MSGFPEFLGLGFHHIVSPDALDHLLFLLVLAVPYRPRTWRHLAGVATAFTLGHSVTLGLVATRAVSLPTPLIEFLIPLTIVGAGLENLRRPRRNPTGWIRPLLAAGFGLIHGAGFANFLREMFAGPPAGPLLAFNLGIELGQLVVLGALLILLAAVDRGLALIRPAPTRATGLGRSAASLLAASWAGILATQRIPW